MDKRTSRVQQVKVISLLNSSIFEIGDATEANLAARVLAVQKEGATFTDKDFPYSDFPIFKVKLPRFDERLVINQTHTPCCPYIDVNSVDILGIASSSLFQIGNIDTIEGEARIKHFRILQEENHTDMER
ncbi:spore germination protein GerPE [Pontibacillus yanchengensis]|uniref:Spore germination protein GerPE n=2 Tax=Pontibacillus yanchengensis TaxID=462910 RepID=A0ACC7VDA9_9BACI|nr:spore germination protein GerPE [Pontibacillus yanchengensis]MYL32301.1 spore germination protein GerPE [Pontibacillus yanchengensis]MYL52881.1 spore germination protein GerPE [Pontibacillus yanchengensis]